MVIDAIKNAGMQIKSAFYGKRFQKMPNQVGLETAHIVFLKLRFQHTVTPPAEVNRHIGQCLVHRHSSIGHAYNAQLLSQRFIKSFT